jgi:hypothetical protein
LPTAFAQIAPWSTRTLQPEDAIGHPLAIDQRHGSRIFQRRQRDNAPLEIGQIVKAYAATLNQIGVVLGIAFTGSRPNFGSGSYALI